MWSQAINNKNDKRHKKGNIVNHWIRSIHTNNLYIKKIFWF